MHTISQNDDTASLKAYTSGDGYLLYNTITGQLRCSCDASADVKDVKEVFKLREIRGFAWR